MKPVRSEYYVVNNICNVFKMYNYNKYDTRSQMSDNNTLTYII